MIDDSKIDFDCLVQESDALRSIRVFGVSKENALYVRCSSNNSRVFVPYEKYVAQQFCHPYHTFIDNVAAVNAIRSTFKGRCWAYCDKDGRNFCIDDKCDLPHTVEIACCSVEEWRTKDKTTRCLFCGYMFAEIFDWTNEDGDDEKVEEEEDEKVEEEEKSQERSSKMQRLIDYFDGFARRNI